MADRRKKKQTIAKEFEITITPWEGMVFSQDPYTIPENMAVWIEGLPKLTGAIEAVPYCSFLVGVTNPMHIRAFSLSDDYICVLRFDQQNMVYYCGIYRSDGSCEGDVRTPLVKPKFDIAVQGNTACWITGRGQPDRPFLRTFDGTYYRDLVQYGVDGDAICYWKGRIFVGKDRTLIFSVPNPDHTGATNPFDTANGAGYIDINLGSFSKILALIPKEDSIYILTNNNIIALLGTTISNDPTQWYLTEIMSGYGISDAGMWTKYEHTIYYHSPVGVLSLVATVPEKIDDAVTIRTGVPQYVRDIGWFVYQGVPYLAVISERFDFSEHAIYCYNILTKKWYAIPINCSSITSIRDITYIATNTSILKLFGSSSSYYGVKVMSKVFFNDANIYYNIRKIHLYGRGDPSIGLKFIDESRQQTLLTCNTLSNPDFFLNTYYFTQALANRCKQFQLVFEQSDSQYSELISVKIKGTLGARYV